ncbi:MAG: DsrE family protein [Methanobacterium sp.]|nr:DsrE family protein [Methanobacterium sp.]
MLSENAEKYNDTLILVLLDGPYVSEYADIGYNLAKSALENDYNVKIFLYMDGAHIPVKNQDPRALPISSQLYEDLIQKGCEIKVCIRCAAARGHINESQYIEGVKITSVYDLAEWMENTDKIITLGG